MDRFLWEFCKLFDSSVDFSINGSKMQFMKVFPNKCSKWGRWSLRIKEKHGCDKLKDVFPSKFIQDNVPEEGLDYHVSEDLLEELSDVGCNDVLSSILGGVL